MKLKRDSSGFSLIELTIVIVIAGLVVAGFFSVATVVVKKIKVEEQKNKIINARLALADFVDEPRPDLYDEDSGLYEAADLVADDGLDGFNEYIGRRLPCPAPVDAGITDIDYGLEQLNTSVPGALACVTGSGVIEDNGVFIGALPFRTLGLSSEDALDVFFNRFTYAVSGNLAQWQGMGTGDPGLITIDQAGDPPILGRRFVLISHGPDGRGSFTAEGIAHANECTGTNPDTENCDDDATFLAQDFSEGSIQFDDSITFTLLEGTSDQFWRIADNDQFNITNRNAGQVGVGNTNPLTQLDVAGEVKIGNSGLLCDSTVQGAMRYNAASDVMEYCSASDWAPIGSGPRVEHGIATVGFFNGTATSTIANETFSAPCTNARVVSQSAKDSVACGTGAGPGACNNDPGTSSTDLISYVANVSSTDFDIYLSTNDTVFVGSKSPAFEIYWLAVCE